jgi:prepilin-type N-terminal cleavage/methylation domain-containing protein
MRRSPAQHYYGCQEKNQLGEARSIEIHASQSLAFGRRGPQGVTLIELLVVVTIIGILVAIGLPAIQRIQLAARETVDVNHAKQLCFTVHQHAETFGRLPGPYTGRCGPDDGWSLSVLRGCGETALADAFRLTHTLDAAVNLRVAAHARPAIFAATALDDTPYQALAADDPNFTASVLPTGFVFNGFLTHKRIEHLQASSQTAMFVRFGPSGLWQRSPEFYAVELPVPGESLLIGFSDGSVGRRTSLVGVIVEP